MGLALGAFNVHVPAVGADHLQPRDDVCTVKAFIRYYTVNRLRESTFHHLAEALTDSAEPSPSYEILLKRSTRLAEEKRGEFEDICNQLNVDENLEEVYHSIVVQIFSDAINLGRILALAAFSAELVVHCARQGREDRAVEVAGWGVNLATQRRLDQWVQEQGGWNQIINNQPTNSNAVATVTTTLVAVISVIATSVIIKTLLQRSFLM